MNLQNLNKDEFIDTLKKMTDEIALALSDLSINRIDRYMNIDTNEQTFIIKVGQFKINPEQLLELIQNENNDLELIEERNTLAVNSETKVIELSTKNKEVADNLKLLIAYTTLDTTEELIDEETTKYILSFRFTKQK